MILRCFDQRYEKRKDKKLQSYFLLKRFVVNIFLVTIVNLISGLRLRVRSVKTPVCRQLNDF